MSVSIDQIFSFNLRLRGQHCVAASAALFKALELDSIEALGSRLQLKEPLKVGDPIQTSEGMRLDFEVSALFDEADFTLVCLTPTPASLRVLRSSGFQLAELSKSDPLRTYWSEIETLEEELAQRGNELLHSERLASLGTLAAGVAHEINNPLAYIKSNLMSLEGFLRPMVITVKSLLEIEAKDDAIIQQLRDLGLKYEPEELGFIIEDLDEILLDLRDGSERIVTIVSGLRQFSHPSKNDLVETDLNDAARVAVELSRNEFKYHAQLEMELAEIPRVKANPAEITQVLVNLIVNASQAIEHAGTIRVGSALRDGAVELWVADTGSGIQEEQLSQIFNPFYTTKEVGKGTGLGLSISHRIMQEHGGEIRVDSEPGKGTKFTLTFPL